MLIILKGKGFSYHVAEELALLTGKAFMHPESLYHEKRKGTVIFSIERFGLLSVRRKFMGMLDVPVYDIATGLIKSRLSIGSVTAVNIEKTTRHPVERIQILRGVLLRRDAFVITSAEEEAGEPFYSLEIVVREIDITLEDI